MSAGSKRQETHGGTQHLFVFVLLLDVFTRKCIDALPGIARKTDQCIDRKETEIKILLWTKCSYTLNLVDLF